MKKPDPTKPQRRHARNKTDLTRSRGRHAGKGWENICKNHMQNYLNSSNAPRICLVFCFLLRQVGPSLFENAHSPAHGKDCARLHPLGSVVDLLWICCGKLRRRVSSLSWTRSVWM